MSKSNFKENEREKYATKYPFTLIASFLSIIVFYGSMIIFGLYLFFSSVSTNKLLQLLIDLKTLIIGTIIIVAFFMIPYLIGLFMDVIRNKTQELQDQKDEEYKSIETEENILNDKKFINKVKKGTAETETVQSEAFMKLQKFAYILSRMIIVVWILKIVGSIMNQDRRK